MKLNKRLVLSIIIIVILPCVSLFAESVFLKNGTIYEGKVVKENDKSITVISEDQTKIEMQRSNIIRIVFHKNYLNKRYLRKTDGTVLEIYLVDEDTNSYTYRTELISPHEVIISKNDVDAIAKSKLEPKDIEKSISVESNGDVKKSEKKPKEEKKNIMKKNDFVDGSPSQTDGFAFLGGYIKTNEWKLSAQGSYYYHVTPTFMLVPYLSFLFRDGYGLSCGSMFTYGTRHRIFFDLGYSRYHIDSGFSQPYLYSYSNVFYENIHNAQVFSVAPGYEFCSDNGFLFRIFLGRYIEHYLYAITDSKSYGIDTKSGFSGSIAAGYKF